MTKKSMTDQKNEKKYGHYVRVSQKAIVYDQIQDKFLIVKVRNENDWYYKNLGPWELIGGSLKENESLSNPPSNFGRKARKPGNLPRKNPPHREHRF